MHVDRRVVREVQLVKRLKVLCAHERRLGVFGLTTCLKGLKNSDRETPSGVKIAASESSVTPLSPRSDLPT